MAQRCVLPAKPRSRLNWLKMPSPKTVGSVSLGSEEPRATTPGKSKAVRSTGIQLRVRGIFMWGFVEWSESDDRILRSQEKKSMLECYFCPSEPPKSLVSIFAHGGRVELFTRPLIRLDPSARFACFRIWLAT